MEKTDLEIKLQTELDTIVRENSDIFTAVLGVTDAGGDFYWSGAAGVANPGTAIAMTAESPFFIASITKMFTAAVTMILEERELISLDDPLSKFLPASLLAGLHVYKGRDYTDRLRIYHLISQTSGLPDYFEEKPRNGLSILDQLITSGDRAWDLDDIVHLARDSLAPKFPPEPADQASSAKKAYYADTNYQLLGAVIEVAAQRSLADLFSELIIEPLALPSTYLYTFDNSLSPEEIPATIYHKTRPLHLDRAMASFGPDGGMVSNTADSLAFLKAFMDGRLFTNPSTLGRMKNWKKIFFPFQYGFGLMRFKLPRVLSPFSPTPELIGHAGSSSAFLYYSEEDGLYISGTLNQTQNQRRPLNLVIKTLKTVSQVLL